MRRKKTSSKIVYALVCICLLLFVGYLSRNGIARLFLSSGNWFFGGGPLYSLTIADDFYKAALFFDPVVSDVWHQRARIDFLHGDFFMAEAKINKQLALHGDELMSSYYIRGLVEGYDKKYPEAEADFTTFLKWDSANWAANNDLAWIYFSEGKFPQAAAQAKKGLAFSPDNPWLLTTHAMSLYNMGDSRTARAELARAREAAAKLSEKDWLLAYPGNDPAVVAKGLEKFKATIDLDIVLVNINR